MLKSFWMAQELLTTFQDDLDAVRILPSSNQGVFAVRLDGNHLLWDRKEQGGFPSPKGLKQLVRDMVEPEKFLGHSDTAERQSTMPGEAVGSLVQGTTAAPAEGSSEGHPNIDRELPDAPQPAVTITYCTGCRWLLRAAYFGQELLTTFGDEIKSVTLVPSKPPCKGGVFVSRRSGGGYDCDGQCCLLFVPQESCNSHIVQRLNSQLP
jgi:selenoprotein W-related protein